MQDSRRHEQLNVIIDLNGATVRLEVGFLSELYFVFDGFSVIGYLALEVLIET